MLKIDSKYNYKLNTDHPPEKQPDQTFRYGLNGVIEKGNLTAITSEKGDNIKYELQGNILGVIRYTGLKDHLNFDPLLTGVPLCSLVYQKRLRTTNTELA